MQWSPPDSRHKGGKPFCVSAGSEANEEDTGSFSIYGLPNECSPGSQCVSLFKILGCWVNYTVDFCALYLENGVQ